MLSKIGVDNLENKFFDFFKFVKFSKNISLKCNSKVEEIISLMVIVDINDYEILDSSVFFELLINIKLVYKSSDGSLHIHNEESIFLREIELKNRIDGSKLFNLYKSKKLKFSVNVLEFDNYMNNNFIDIYVHMILSASYIRGYCLALLLQTSAQEKNIYLCFDSGKDLKQITFSMNTEFSKIRWGYGRNLISYLKSGQEEGFYVYDIKNSRETFICSGVLSYDFIDENNVILEINNKDMEGIYVYNRQNKKFKLAIKSAPYIKLSYIIFREDLSKIFFVREDKGSLALCMTDNNFTNFKEIIKLDSQNIHSIYGFSYVISFNEDNILFYDCKNNRSFNLLYPSGGFSDIKDFALAGEDKIAILYNDGSIYFFDDKYKSFNKIQSEITYDVRGLCFAYDNSSLYASLNIMGYYNLYKISKDGEFDEVTSLYSEDTKIIRRY